MKRRIENAELESNQNFNLKMTENSSKDSIDNKNKIHYDENSKLQEFKLTIQIEKIYLRPCPKSKKINQIKMNGSNFQNIENKSFNTDEHIDTIYHQCMICKQPFSNISELYMHLREHLTCDICKTEFTSKKLYHKHCKLHKSKIKEFPYKCHVCDLLFETKEAIQTHSHITLDKYDNSTGENRIQYCKTCNMTFRNKAIYRKHLNSHIDKMAASQQKEQTVAALVPGIPAVGHLRPVIFSCRVCSQNFTSIAEIDKHTRDHMKELKFDYKE